MLAVENVTGPVAYHAEGPVWSPSWGGLRWVDLTRGDLLTLRDHGVDRLHVGDVAAFHRPRAGGGFVVGLERGLGLADSPEGPVRALPEVWSDPGVRFNDGGCSPAGTLYAGTMAYDAAPGRGQLFRISAAGGRSTVLDAVGISNGIAWSPDGTLAYYVDSLTGRVDVFDDEDDQLVGRRPFTTVEGGGPDGLTVDAEGGVWVALWGGAAVHRYDASGALSAVVEIPAAQVSACTFGGDDLGTLFVTTSRENLPDGEDPQAGSVFAVEAGVRGLPVLPYAG
ncbi:SMP-30/gluconolactonase/LRE family protein [Oryzihumus sp.]